MGKSFQVTNGMFPVRDGYVASTIRVEVGVFFAASPALFVWTKASTALTG